MTDDPIIEEIHAIRKKICEECDYDFNRLTERYIKLQQQHSELLVRQVPKAEKTEIAVE
ncbi:MAG: hypothetical protein ABSA16_00485 [Thermoguttaceae bacterium]|jgi:hypothetical protein